MSFQELIRSACCTGETLQNEALGKGRSYKTVFDPGNKMIGFVFTIDSELQQFGTDLLNIC